MRPETQTLIGSPGPSERTFTTANGDVLNVPDAWQWLAPGDAGLTRRVKSSGPTWTMKERRGRREFSRGIWADGAAIETAKRNLDAQRATPQHAKALAASRQRREVQQGQYVDEFDDAVVAFLNFDAKYAAIARSIARLVTAHATPVGSGTVARTSRIPIEKRAESAVIAWMRHQTTAYDDMAIARVKGRRREVRRELAGKSRDVLQKYRRGDQDAVAGCPLAKAVRQAAVT